MDEFQAGKTYYVAFDGTWIKNMIGNLIVSTDGKVHVIQGVREAPGGLEMLFAQTANNSMENLSITRTEVIQLKN